MIDAIVAIPCYNCAPQLPRVLEQLAVHRPDAVREVWVIDNGSTDGTVGAAQRFAAEGRLPGLRVFRNRENVNLGGTHKVAFTKAAAAGATHVVILHGDDQASGAEVGDLIADSAAHGDITVLGSRFSRASRLHGYDAARIAGNRVLNAVYCAGTRRLLTDLGSGLNLFALRDLDPATYLAFGDRLSFNYELLLDLVRRRVPFRYLPISWSETDQVSNARNVQVFTDGVRILGRWLARRPTSAADAHRPATDYDFDEVTRG